MSDIIGKLRFNLAGADKLQFVWLGAILLTIAILAVLHHKWRYYDGRLKQWKKLCFIPFIISMLHFIIYTAPHLLQNYTPMYLISLLPLITALCAERDKGYRKVAPIIWVLTAVFGLRFIFLDYHAVTIPTDCNSTLFSTSLYERTTRSLK